jgi:uncharacterized repeat protein (TIGR03803 family)
MPTFILERGGAKHLRFSVLYAFTGQADGGAPMAGVIRVGSYLYGTTGFGTVYRVPLAGGTIVVLYTFKGGSDGGFPSGLINVGQSLYGTTAVGGDIENRCGTVFRVPITGGSESKLFSFNKSADGVRPTAVLIKIGSYLYSTTSGGGTYGVGTVFRVPLEGGGESVFHSFKDGPDGAEPFGPVTLINGKLYGTTYLGGGFGPSGYGTVFSLPLEGGLDKIVHAFTHPAGPEGALLDIGESVYGTTTGGDDFGTVFKF